MENSTMQLIEADHFHALLDHLVDTPDLADACRWLACGPSMAPLILGEDARRPSSVELARLAALFDSAPPQAAQVGRALLAAHEDWLAEIDIALERLILAKEPWSHPTQILGRPCPDLAQVSDACHELLEDLIDEELMRLVEIRMKLDRAARLDALARRRREEAA